MVLAQSRYDCYARIINLAAQDMEMSRIARMIGLSFLAVALLLYALVAVYALMDNPYGWVASISAGLCMFFGLWTPDYYLRERERRALTAQCIDRITLLSRYALADDDAQWAVVAQHANIDDIEGASDVYVALRRLPGWLRRIHLRRSAARYARWVDAIGLNQHTT